MQKKKYYAVVVGAKTGVYNSWSKCEKLVRGFSGAKYKGFTTLKEANNYLNDALLQTETEDFSKSIAGAIEFAESQKMHFKDKPVNGLPTKNQLECLDSFCNQKAIQIKVVGLTKKEASELIGYLMGNGLNMSKPKCYDRYVKDLKKTIER